MKLSILKKSSTLGLLDFQSIKQLHFFLLEHQDHIKFFVKAQE